MSTATESGGVVPVWTLADRLVKAREHAGMSQRDIASALDVSLRTVNRYEAGEPAKRVYVLGWSFVCGVDPGWLEHGISPHTGTPTTGVSDCYGAQYLAA